MNHFFDFLLQNWALSLLFFVLLLTFIAYEAKGQGFGLKIMAQELVRKMNDNAVKIYDIRSSDAFRVGHIFSSKSVQEADLLAEGGLLSKLNGSGAVIVCSNGAKSGRLVSQLKKNFKESELFVLSGGVDEWGRQKLPLQAGKK
jgi:rhodanese-related sulfurtransferase